MIRQNLDQTFVQLFNEMVNNRINNTHGLISTSISDVNQYFKQLKEDIYSNTSVNKKKSKELTLMNYMDLHADIQRAIQFKYRLNIINNKNENFFYQLKGQLGYNSKGKKIWVYFSLGPKALFEKNYSSMTEEQILEYFRPQMVDAAFKKLRQLRE